MCVFTCAEFHKCPPALVEVPGPGRSENCNQYNERKYAIRRPAIGPKAFSDTSELCPQHSAANTLPDVRTAKPIFRWLDQSGIQCSNDFNLIDAAVLFC